VFHTNLENPANRAGLQTAQTESLFLHCVLQGPPQALNRLHSSLSLPSSAVQELKAEKIFEIPVTVGLGLLLLSFYEAIGKFPHCLER